MSHQMKKVWLVQLFHPLIRTIWTTLCVIHFCGYSIQFYIVQKANSISAKISAVSKRQIIPVCRERQVKPANNILLTPCGLCVGEVALGVKMDVQWKVLENRNVLPVVLDWFILGLLIFPNILVSGAAVGAQTLTAVYFLRLFNWAVCNSGSYCNSHCNNVYS